MDEIKDYEVKDTGHSFRVGIGNYGFAEVFYKHERVQTPVEKENAEVLANYLKHSISVKYPFSDIDLDDYESTSLMEILSDGEVDGEELTEISGEKFMQLMMMKALLSD